MTTVAHLRQTLCPEATGPGSGSEANSWGNLHWEPLPAPTLHGHIWQRKPLTSHRRQSSHQEPLQRNNQGQRQSWKTACSTSPHSVAFQPGLCYCPRWLSPKSLGHRKHIPQLQRGETFCCHQRSLRLFAPKLLFCLESEVLGEGVAVV
jgi:hypothetical protein